MIMEEKLRDAVTLPSFHNYLIAISAEHFTFTFTSIFIFTFTQCTRRNYFFRGGKAELFRPGLAKYKDD